VLVVDCVFTNGIAYSCVCHRAGDKLRGELSSTSAELQQERAQRQQAEAEGEAARLQLGGTKQQMAKTAAELERERETAAAMKDRVNKLNANFMQTSEWQLCGMLGPA
jgi:hypothetical protein